MNAIVKLLMECYLCGHAFEAVANIDRYDVADADISVPGAIAQAIVDAMRLHKDECPKESR